MTRWQPRSRELGRAPKRDSEQRFGSERAIGKKLLKSVLFFDVGNNNLLAFFDFPGQGLQPGMEVLELVWYRGRAC